MENYVGQEQHDFIQEYLESFSSMEQIEEFKQCCRNVLAKREREMVEIDSLDTVVTHTPETKRQRVVVVAAETPASSEALKHDTLFRTLSKLWVGFHSVVDSPESSHQLQNLGLECLDAFFRAQHAMDELMSTILNNFPHHLPCPRSNLFPNSQQQQLTIPNIAGEPDIHSINDIEILDRVDVSMNEPMFRSYLCQAKATGHVCEVQIFPLDPKLSLSSIKERVKRWKKATRECAFIEKIYSVFTDGAFIYFVIEPSIGPTLLDIIRQGHTISNEESVKKISVQIMACLEALHRNKIVYCDLCPENIYVCSDGTVKLMSYPLIKYICLSTSKEKCLGSIAEYIAPELMRYRRPSVAHCTDLWCFGALVYEMYTGLPLFCGDNNFPVQVYMRILAYNEEDCENYCEHMPEPLKEVVCSLLKGPEERATIVQLKKMKFFLF